MSHQHLVAEPIATPEDAALDAAAHGADRRLMADLLRRVLLDLDSPEAVADLRCYLNHRAPAERATRLEVLAELPEPTGTAPAEVVQLAAGAAGGQGR